MNIQKELFKLVYKYYLDESEEFYHETATINGVCVVLQEFIINFFQEKSKKDEVQDFNLELSNVDCGPGYSTGFIFIAWIEKDNQLNTDFYQWENY